MPSDAKALADGVVESFRQLLDGDARDLVGDHLLNALHGMVSEAIAEHAESIFEQLERELRKLHSDMIERKPLEL